MTARALTSLLTFASLATAAVAQTHNPNNGHYYQLFTQSTDWNSANAAASALTYNGLQGHLVTVTSQAETDWIVSTFGAAAIDNAYMGLYQDASAPDYSEPTGGWRWVTGEAFGYTNWSGGEPNNNGAENVGHFWAGSGLWNDIDPSWSFHYMVEYSDAANPVPEPGTMLVLGAGAAFVALKRRRRA